MSKIDEIKSHPTVAHLLRANKRFGNRLGNQFGGAITYFSVLAMVPILMVAFALTGMVLTTFRPDLLQQLMSTVATQLQGAPGDTTEQITGVIEEALTNWPGIGIFGLLSFLYAAGGWIGNLKAAVQAQWFPDFETEPKSENIVVKTLKNIGTMLLLIIAVAVTFGIATLATSMTGTIIDALGLSGIPGIGFLARLVSVLASLLAGWLLFLFLYRALPGEKPVTKAWLYGALIGAVALIVLQYLTGMLMGSFSKNPAAALFGPVIILMLFFNLFARLILFVAAWIATWNQPAVARKWTEADAPLRNRSDVRLADDHWEEADEDKHQQEMEKAEAKVKQAATVNKVKDAVPGLEPKPEAEQEAAAELSDKRHQDQQKARERKREEVIVDAVRDRYRGGKRPEGEQAAYAAAMTEKTNPAAASGRKRAYAGGIEDKRRFDTEGPVSHRNAVRNAQASLGLGYLTGLFTGTGLGALLAVLRKGR